MTLSPKNANIDRTMQTDHGVLFAVTGSAGRLAASAQQNNEMCSDDNRTKTGSLTVVRLIFPCMRLRLWALYIETEDYV